MLTVNRELANLCGWCMMVTVVTGGSLLNQRSICFHLDGVKIRVLLLELQNNQKLNVSNVLTGVERQGNGFISWAFRLYINCYLLQIPAWGEVHVILGIPCWCTVHCQSFWNVPYGIYAHGQSQEVVKFKRGSWLFQGMGHWGLCVPEIPLFSLKQP